MGTINKLLRVFTHEGAKARAFTPAEELRRSVLNCLLWEDQFYEDGQSIAARIRRSCPRWSPRPAPHSPSRRARR